VTATGTKLLETIKCKDGKLCNLGFHQKRFQEAREELGFPDKIILKDAISIPGKNRAGLWRCRVVYSKRIKKIEFLPHQYKKIESLKLVFDDSIDYHLKYSNREYLNQLYEKRGDCDDIVIVKNGFIADSWNANPIFFDGKIWWTSDTPLLPGTQRARLISEGKLSVCRITLRDLSKYQKVGLINALQDLHDMPVLKVENIRY